MGPVEQPSVGDRLDLLIARAIDEGCVELSEVSELIADLRLEEADVDQLFQRLEESGVEISDDCGREVSERVTYANESLAAKTTDALDLFFGAARQFRLLSASDT